MANWDSMLRIVTQARGQAFQTLGQLLFFSKAVKSWAECFKSSAEPFKGLAAYFETNARPSLLINGHIKSF